MFASSNIFQLTLLVAAGFVAFPRNYVLSQRFSATPCPSKHFTCRNGGCISAVLVCDGTRDCEDGSDENHVTCANFQCPNNKFVCAYGACTDGDSICNGIIECADGSDELTKSCPGVKWATQGSANCDSRSVTCSNGQCIDISVLCDGKVDCEDKSDETVTACNHLRCPSNTFRCAYGGCVENNSKCNGIQECADGSDEDNLLCSGSFVSIANGYRPVTSTLHLQKRSGASSHRCVVPASGLTTKYSLENCRSYEICEAVPEDQLVNHEGILYITCQQGFDYAMHSHYSLCQLGKWDPEPSPCIRLCEPINITNVEATCKDNNIKPVNCSDYMRPGTQATLNCKRGYFQTKDISNIKCKENGEWGINFSSLCEHECGIRSSSSVPLISNGIKAKQADHPWNAGLYLNHKGNIRHICGGTLITPVAVLTAAHCVVRSTNNQKRLPKSLLIGLGKIHRELYHPDDRETAQIIGVRDIHVPDAFDNAGNFRNDVAIIELVKSADINVHYVIPACLDLDGKIKLESGFILTVVGWGLDGPNCEEGEAKLPGCGVQPDELQEAILPYVDAAACKEIAKGNKTQEPMEKFCAFFIERNDSTVSVRMGGSGAGLIYKNSDGKYYVLGLVSTLIGDYISTFTDTRFGFISEFIKAKLHLIWTKHN